MSLVVARLPVMLQVVSEFDVAAVVVVARRFCVDLGATPVCAAHVATAASELANNLWMHSSHGGRIGLRCGLPGVRRLMDEFDLASTPGRGTQVLARKWWRDA